MILDAHRDNAARLLAACAARRLTLATAESCTGGLVSACLTAIAGASQVVECGFVTYSNAAKMRMLGVPAALLEAHGAVSRETAIAMAEGALLRAEVSLALAITGIAGPGGGSARKPVGLVHFALARSNGPTLHRKETYGDCGRDAVRVKAVTTALAMLTEAADAC